MTMPNFLIIGAEKAGTTFLHHYLQQLPQICMSPQKETNFCVFEGQKLYRQLTAVFRQDILQLQNLIERDLSPWLKQTELNQ